MASTPTYVADLHQIGSQITALASRGDAEEIMTVLSALTSNSSDEALLARLRKVRREAARVAVAAAGGKAPLARKLGVSETTVYRALGDERRIRKPAKT